MQARQIDPGNRRDVRRFIRFPFRLYRGNPYWVPPMEAEMRTALNPAAHPYYRHSEAAFFLAEQDGEMVGRLAVLNHTGYRQQPGCADRGLFCFFECVDDLDAARALFDAGATWAARRGIRTLIGPKGLAQGDGQGILVEGFDHLPAMGIPYNLPYYGDHLEALGFEKQDDLLSGFLRAEDYHLPERVVQLAERVKARRGFHVREFKTKDEMRALVPQVRRVYNQAFADVPGFVPVSEEEVRAIADRILSIADPRLIKLVFKGEEVAGFLFAYPNIGRGLQRARGRMWPLGWWHILREFKRTRMLDINGIGLLPGYQGVGATAVLYAELERTVRQFGFEFADIVQINEKNLKSFSEMDHLGVNWYKRHRIYRKEF